MTYCEKKVIIKRFVVFSIGIFLNYSGYLALLGLQSSINIEDGVGIETIFSSRIIFKNKKFKHKQLLFIKAYFFDVPYYFSLILTNLPENPKEPVELDNPNTSAKVLLFYLFRLENYFAAKLKFLVPLFRLSSN